MPIFLRLISVIAHTDGHWFLNNRDKKIVLRNCDVFIRVLICDSDIQCNYEDKGSWEGKCEVYIWFVSPVVEHKLVDRVSSNRKWECRLCFCVTHQNTLYRVARRKTSQIIHGRCNSAFYLRKILVSFNNMICLIRAQEKIWICGDQWRCWGTLGLMSRA